MAEKVGFEPTDRVTPVNALAGRPIRPLWHFSACESTAATEETETVDESGAFTNLENGTVAEWTIAPALKADVSKDTGGSNPPRSAHRRWSGIRLVSHRSEQLWVAVERWATVVGAG